jgi:hypothetical protein
MYFVPRHVHWVKFVHLILIERLTLNTIIILLLEYNKFRGKIKWLTIHVHV